MNAGNYKRLSAMLGSDLQKIIKEQQAQGFQTNERQLNKVLNILRFFDSKATSDNRHIEILSTSYNAPMPGLSVAFLTDELSIHQQDMKQFCRHLKNMSLFIVVPTRDEGGRIMILYAVPAMFTDDN